MKRGQIIKVTESWLYKNENGEILDLSAEQKLMHSIFTPNLVVYQKIEQIVSNIYGKNRKEIDVQYYNYMINNNIEDYSNYYLLIHTQ